MKFYQISEILNNKKIRPSQISNNKKIYNYLYNDYTYRNNKKEKMRHDKLYHESELYPFSPLINKSGYITFSPNNIDNFTPYTSRYDFYRKNNPNQKYSTFTESYPVQRNILTENNLYDTNRYFNPNNIDDYRNLNNDYYNNGDIQNYFNKNLINNNKFKKGNKKGSLNRTGYGFYNPIYKPKNIYSNKDDEINSKISEYLNNFQNNSKRFNNLDSINNTNNDIYPKKRNKSNANISRGSKYNLLGEEQSQFNNNNEIPYNSNFKRINEINNNYNKLKKDINYLNNEINILKNEINKLKRNKINNYIKIKNNKIDELNNNKIKELNKNINNKYEELKKDINNNEYINKINYKFKKEPNLKYKLDITNTNTNYGWNDIFEIFISYKDNKEYLISPNIITFNLDIFTLLKNNKILSLKGHKNNIRTIRYFINKKNYNEYLISGDKNKIVIIWDITNNYNIKYQIDTKYGDVILSCLLIFPHNIDENYIISSTFNTSDDNDKSATKIYLLNNVQFSKYVKNTNNNHIYYLLSWYNKKNNKYYIIQFSFKKIIINNLIEDKFYSELKQVHEGSHLSGFIYERENTDYLCSSSSNGYIYIWDLYNKIIFKVINTNKCFLAHIIEWNNKYIIVADFNNKSFKIIDLEENKIICDINGEHNGNVKCIKKIYHPIYGESLLSAAKDNTIKLWII